MTSTITESSTITTQQHIRINNNKKTTTTKTRTDLEETAVPDSTTTIEKEMTEFYSGQDVFLKQKDGRYYLGTVVEIDNIREQCLIKFGDNTERWSNYKDLNKLTTPEEQDLFCVVCKKVAPKNNNEITVCDKCGRGYHQKCHQPNIPVDCQKDGANWICKRCMNNEPHRLRKSESKYLRRDSSFRNISASSTIDTIQRTNNVSSTKVLPYDLSSLNWDTFHRVNTEHTYCYCGCTGEWFNQMLQCARCRQWFHEKCLSCLQFPLYCGDRFYVFVCSICNNGKEFLRRLEMKWVDVVHLMLYNLTAYNSKKYYDLDKTIIPYINDNWHALQLPPEIYDDAKRRENILFVLTKNRNRFKCGREIKKRTTIWGLRVPLPPPSPTITVRATNGCITEEDLKEMWQSNRRLQFLPLNSTTNNNNLLLIKNNSRMKDIMMGVAYQQSNTQSETDGSPCPSPEVEQQDVAQQRIEDGLKFINNHNNNKNNNNEYLGGGYVKKSVPFTNISLQRRKRLLSANNRERERILRKPNKRRNTNDGVFDVESATVTTTTTLSVSVAATTTTTIKTKRLSLDNKNNNETLCPLTPPTSVSAPPTPPASSSTTTLSDLSNDFSEFSNNITINHNANTNNNTRSKRTTNFSNVIPSNSNNNINNNNTIGGSGCIGDPIELNTPCDTSGDETSSKSTLDLIIPRPKDFEGKNNPFLTLLRGNLDDKQLMKKGKNKDKSITLPLSLNAVIPGKPVMRPMKRQLSEKDIFIGPNGEVKRRRLRRSRQLINSHTTGQTASKTATVVPIKSDCKEWVGESQQQTQQPTNDSQINNCVDYALNGRRLRQRPDKVNLTDKDKNQSRISSSTSSTTTTTSNKSSPVKQEPDINMDDLKSSVNSYFGAANRIAAGERFTVKAKRIGPSGKLELLIDWEGPGNGMT